MARCKKYQLGTLNPHPVTMLMKELASQKGFSMRFMIWFGIICMMSACSLNTGDSPQPTSQPTIASRQPSDAYFLSPDANGVYQVWSFALDGSQSQLTTWGSDIDSFSISPDESTLVFASGNMLYIRQNDIVREIVPLTSEHVQGQPDFSPDGKLVAYIDNGVWLLDISTLEPNLLMENIEASLGEESLNLDTMQYFSLPDFVDNNTIQVEIGIWEGVVPGFIDIQTGTVSESERYTYTDMLIMNADTLVVYSDTLRGAQPGLYAADRSNPADVREILPSGFGITSAEQTNYIIDAARVNDDVVRFIASWITIPTGNSQPMPQIGIIDFTLSTGQINPILVTQNDTHPMLNMMGHSLSPDGRYILGYQNATMADTAGGISEFTGGLIIYRVATEQVFTLDIPIRQFAWHE